MNPKRLPEITMVACLVILAAWWWWPVKPVPMNPTVVRAHVPTPTEETTLPPVTPTPPVVAAEIPTPAAFDPQTDLSTAIPDYIRLLQSGDFLTLVNNYFPPGSFTTDLARAKMVETWQAIDQTPEGQRSNRNEIADMQFIQASTPIISDDGNTATYELPPGWTASLVVFVKINGRWYKN